MKKKQVQRKSKPKSPRKQAKPRLAGLVRAGVEKFSGLFSSEPKDIVEAIEDDHRSLRNFLGVLKDTDKNMEERRRAYVQFAALLKSHSRSEEKAVYDPTLKLAGKEMHIKVAEGFVEHQVADDLMARLETAKDPLTWSAHANVLSEDMEHHLKEEERDLLPLIRKAASAELNQEMLRNFISLRALSQKKISKRNAGVLET